MKNVDVKEGHFLFCHYVLEMCVVAPLYIDKVDDFRGRKEVA